MPASLDSRRHDCAGACAPSRHAGRLRRREGQHFEGGAAESEFTPKVFVNATGTYNEGNLNASAIPSVGPNLPATFNISGPRLAGSVFAAPPRRCAGL